MTQTSPVRKSIPFNLRIFGAVALCGLIFGGLWGAIGPFKTTTVAAADPDEPKAPLKAADVSFFMKAKLEHAKKLLEGLTIEDLPMLEKHAADLSLLSQSSTWEVIQTTEYRQRSQEFRRITDRISQAAKKKDLEGAAFGYVEMTMKCIDCHNYVRKSREETAKP